MDILNPSQSLCVMYLTELAYLNRELGTRMWNLHNLAKAEYESAGAIRATSEKLIQDAYRTRWLMLGGR